jgi:hypothetical protein
MCSGGFVKDTVLREKVQNVYELRDTIVRTTDSVTNEMLVQTWTETQYHLDVCNATNGAHTDIYKAHDKRNEVHCLKTHSSTLYG